MDHPLTAAELLAAFEADVGAVLLEQHDDWAVTDRRDLSEDSMAVHDATGRRRTRVSAVAARRRKWYESHPCVLERWIAASRSPRGGVERVRTPERPQLGRAAKGFRVAHALIGLLDLVGLGYLWACALTGRRDRLLRLSVAALLVEGVALVVGPGNCPLGPLQRRLGDPVPLFELVLPRRAAKAAVPVLVAISAAGMALIVIRRPSHHS